MILGSKGNSPVLALLIVTLRTVNLNRPQLSTGVRATFEHSLLVADPHAEVASIEHKICGGVLRLKSHLGDVSPDLPPINPPLPHRARGQYIRVGSRLLKAVPYLPFSIQMPVKHEIRTRRCTEARPKAAATHLGVRSPRS